MMSRRIVLAACWVVASLSMAAVYGEDALLDGFQNPPDSARPRVWWHWMNGNVTEEGIRLDLEWMKRVGIRGFQTFDAAIATPQIVDERLIYMTPPWKHAFRFAAGLAQSLGLEMAIAASPGFSETGGPWVPPAESMKKFVWSEMDVRGGVHVHLKLPHPPTVTGPFQNMPSVRDLRSNGLAEDPPQFYADVAVVAYRWPPVAAVPAPGRILSSSRPAKAQPLANARHVSGIDLDVTQGQPWLRIEFDAPQTISSVSLRTPQWGAPFGRSQWSAVLQTSIDGRSFRRVAEFPPGISPQYTLTFAPVTARHFRFEFTLPLITDGPFNAAPGAVLFSPFKVPESGSEQRIRIDEVRLYSSARVHRFEEKAGFEVTPDYYGIETPANAKVEAVPVSGVIDLTSRMRRDGTLEWAPPRGRWKILRFGYSLLGTENHPATAEATGLEVDKLDRAAVENYINTYLDTYRDAVGPDLIGRRGVRAVLNDSIEVGAQNWTRNLPAEFQSRRGYDLTPWLPVLTGVIIESSAKSDAFLYDFRRTLADLLAENHYAQIARSVHARGLIHYSEALEDGRPMLGDDMDMRRHADVPMAAMWTFPSGGAPLAVHFADMRGAASVAHIYGKKFAAAESLTSEYAPWAFSPRDLQPLIDMEFAAGINQPVIHTSVHQPRSDCKPGLSLAIYGQYFNRNETWAEQAGPWIDYISRSAYLLQQGRFVADVLYFYGEEAPLTGLFRDKFPKDTPTSSGFDFAGADVVLNRLAVEDGDLVTAGGMRYRVLFLGGSSRYVTLPVLRRLRELVAAGATVVGERPVSSPSLSDNQQEFQQLAEQMWPANCASAAVISLGTGRLVCTQDIEAALQKIGIRPDFTYEKPQPDSELLFLHRLIDESDIYFITNRRARAQDVTARFRTTGKRPELWHAQSGKREPVSYKIEGEVTAVPLEFISLGSVFVVFREPAEKNFVALAKSQLATLATLNDGWQLRFEGEAGVSPDMALSSIGAWNENSDPAVRYFSGTGSYTRNIDVRRSWLDGYDAVWLDLGVVRELAEIVVNGRSLGVLWKEPYRVNIRDVLRPGSNQIQVRVTNLWVNRLIGDAQPNAQKATFTAVPTYRADAPLRLSGLIGPVTLTGQAPEGALAPQTSALRVGP